MASLFLVGYLSYRTGNYTKSESAYKQAIHLQPRNGDIYNNPCWVNLCQNAEIEKAEDLIKKATTTVAEHRAYYVDTLGVMLLRLGRTTESITELKEAALLSMDNSSILAESYDH